MMTELLDAIMRELIPRIGEPQRSTLTPAPSVIASFLELLKNFVQKQDFAEFRAQLIEMMTQIVRDITKADCVFVRRLNTDGSSELVGKPAWFANEGVGCPPRVKSAGQGVSGCVLQNQITEPVVIWNIHAAEVPEMYRNAHQATLARWSDRNQPEYAFTRFFHAEICIPLVIGGKIIGAIVGLGQPYDKDRAEQLQQVLKSWQELLAFLYFNALALERQERQQAALRSIHANLPLIARAASNDEFLRKMLTTLTCDSGLAWHRAMLFIFEQPYPADARCVMAVGGIGEAGWSDAQDRLAGMYHSLDDYLQYAEIGAFAHDDPLFQISQSADKPLVAPKDALVANKALHALLSGQQINVSNDLVDGVGLMLASDDAWLTSISNFSSVFTGLTSGCPHFLIPLLWPSHESHSNRQATAIGFLILDNPYTQSVDQCNNLVHTGLVCNLFASLMLNRQIAPADKDYPEEWDGLLRLGVSNDKLTRLVQAFRNVNPDLFRTVSGRTNQQDDELESVLRQIRTSIDAGCRITADTQSLAK